MLPTAVFSFFGFLIPASSLDEIDFKLLSISFFGTSASWASLWVCVCSMPCSLVIVGVAGVVAANWLVFVSGALSVGVESIISL